MILTESKFLQFGKKMGKRKKHRMNKGEKNVLILKDMLSMILTNGNEITDSRVFECIFIFAMYWSIGAALTEDSRVAFDSFVKMISDWPSIGTFLFFI